MEEEEEVVFDLWAPLSSSPKQKRTASFAKKAAAEKVSAEEALVASMKAAAAKKKAKKKAKKIEASHSHSQASPKRLAMQWLGHAVLIGREEEEDEEEEELASSTNPDSPSGLRPPSPPPSASGDTPDTQMRPGWIYTSPAAITPIDARASPSSSQFRPPLPSSSLLSSPINSPSRVWSQLSRRGISAQAAHGHAASVCC
jgi:hypothetical protein